MNRPLLRQWIHRHHNRKGYADLGAKAAQLVETDRVNFKRKGMML